MKFNITVTIIRVVLMAISFVGIVMLIQKMESNGLSPGLMQLFGISKPETTYHNNSLEGIGARSAKVLSDKSLLWCETRVQGLEGLNGVKLVQEKFKWFWGSDKEELNFVKVEKWFGRHCQVKIEPQSQARGHSAMNSILKVFFIKGAPEELLRSESGIYSWKGRTFRSADLDQALKELQDLPHINDKN